MDITQIIGDITNKELYSKNPEEYMIIQQLNCVAVKPHGISASIALAFPHSNVYAKRKSIGDRNCAVMSDRPKTGTIEICRSKGDVSIANLFAQFFYGKSRSNLHKSYHDYVKRKSNFNEDDNDLMQKIITDNEENRLKWFGDCLKELEKELEKDEKIKNIMVPYKIGCGRAGGYWEDYFNKIKNFASLIKQNVIIVKLDDENYLKK